MESVRFAREGEGIRRIRVRFCVKASKTSHTRACEFHAWEIKDGCEGPLTPCLIRPPRDSLRARLSPYFVSAHVYFCETARNKCHTPRV